MAKIIVTYVWRLQRFRHLSTCKDPECFVFAFVLQQHKHQQQHRYQQQQLATTVKHKYQLFF